MEKDVQLAEESPPVEESPIEEIQTDLSRDLSLFHVTMMGVGMMIGAGVFLGVGNSVAIAGPGGALLTFALNALLAIFSAMSYAELSSAIPRAGGAYNFTRVAFGRGTSFIGGWMEWFASSVAGSLYAVTFGIYTVHYLTQLGLLDWVPLETATLEKAVAILVALLFLYINYRGASETGKTGAFFTLGQTLALVLIAIAGIVVAIRDPGRLANFQPFLPNGWRVLLMTMGFTYVAFEGFEVIAQAGDETVNPRRNLPKAILYSIGIVGVTYVAVTFAALIAVKGTGMPAWEWIGQFKEKGFGEAVGRLMPFGSLLVTLAVIFAATSALNATVYSATRASYALGRDRMLPAFFARISKKHRTPYVALGMTGFIVILIAAFLPVMDVASSASIMFLALFLLVNLSVIRIRRNMADELTYGYIMPLFPLFPVLAIVAQIALAAWLIHMSWIAWIIAPCWIGAGVLVFVFYARKHTTVTRDEIVTFEEDKAPPRPEGGFHILVPVAHPDNAINIVGQVIPLAEANDASVELIHVIPIPDQVPLSDAPKYMLEGKEAITEAMLYLAMRFPLSSTVRYCRNPARAIITAARQRNAEMVILGWHGHPRRREFIFGSTVDQILERSPSRVVVLKECGDPPYKKVLVPIAGGPNSVFALRIASILVDRVGGSIVPFTVARPGRETLDLEAFLTEAGQSIDLSDRCAKPKYVIEKDITHAILTEAKDYDLVIIGASAERGLKRIAMGSIPEAIARRCSTPLIMVKSKQGLRRFLDRWV